MIPHLSIYSFPVFMAFLLNLGLIVLVLVRLRLERIHKTFIAWNAALALWNLGAFGIYSAPTRAVAMEWNWFCYFGIAFIPGTFFDLILLLTHQHSGWRRKLLYALYVWGTVLCGLNAAYPGLISGEITSRFWGFGPGVNWFGILLIDPVLVGIPLYSLLLLRRAVRETSDDQRNQLQYVFWGTVVAFVGGAINFMVVHGLDIYPFGNLLNILYSLAIGYAIVEHGLMDIRLVFRHGVVYGTLLTSLTAFYLTIVTLLKQIFGHYGLTENYTFYTAAFPLTVLFAPNMKNQIEHWLDETPFWKMPSLENQTDSAMLGLMATEIAHEVTKPLTRILHEGNRLRNTKIEEEVLRATEILEGLTMLSPQVPLRREETSVRDLLEETLYTLGMSEDDRLTIIRQFGSVTPVQANSSQIRHVLLNILQNAWEAMPEGGTLNLIIRASGSSHVQIVITDSGPGVAGEIRDQLFKPFVTTRKNRPGRGLGLSLSRMMMERHGGTISIDSPLTTIGGTRVCLTLPI